MAELETVETERAAWQEGVWLCSGEWSMCGEGADTLHPRRAGSSGRLAGARPGVCAGEPLAVLSKRERRQEADLGDLQFQICFPVPCVQPWVCHPTSLNVSLFF